MSGCWRGVERIRYVGVYVSSGWLFIWLELVSWSGLSGCNDVYCGRAAIFQLSILLGVKLLQHWLRRTMKEEIQDEGNSGGQRITRTITRELGDWHISHTHYCFSGRQQDANNLLVIRVHWAHNQLDTICTVASPNRVYVVKSFNVYGNRKPQCYAEHERGLYLHVESSLVELKRIEKRMHTPRCEFEVTNTLPCRCFRCYVASMMLEVEQDLYRLCARSDSLPSFIVFIQTWDRMPRYNNLKAVHREQAIFDKVRASHKENAVTTLYVFNLPVARWLTNLPNPQRWFRQKVLQNSNVRLFNYIFQTAYLFRHPID